MQNFDITIIGGSFAGMTAALVLAQISSDLKIAVIEQKNILEEDYKRDGRAYAISSASLQVFKKIGIFDELQSSAAKIADIKITDYKSPFVLDFIGLEVDPKNGQLGQIIESYLIHKALKKRVLEFSNITIFAPNSYHKISFGENSFDQASTKKSDNYEVKVEMTDGQMVNSKLLLACDGRFSKLRELFQIKTTQKKYFQTAIVFNIEHELPHKNMAYEKFLPGGPLAILPLPNQNQSSIVWIAPDATAQAILELDQENFIDQLQRKMENSLGKVATISDKFSYPLTLVEAEKFYHEKMLLIGDAAAGVHPIAGQGFNLAIAGIEILAEIISQKISSKDEIFDSELIKNYNKKAKINAKKMLVATDVLNSLFETRSLSVSLARDLGLGLVNKLPKLKNFFIKSAGGY